MSDAADLAFDIESERLAKIMANRPKAFVGVSACECEECGAAIPEGRRKALPGVQTCVNCAQLSEDKTAFQQGRVR